MAKLNESSRLALVLPEPGAAALALDRVSEVVWVARGTRLAGYSFTGERIAELTLPGDLTARAPVFLEAWERDGTLWLAAGEELWRYSSQAALLGRWPLPGRASAAALEQAAGLLWIGVPGWLLYLDAASGSELGRIALPATPRSVAVGDGIVVVALPDQLRAFEQGHLVWQFPCVDPRELAFAPQGVWVRQEQQLALVSRQGKLLWSQARPQLMVARAMAASPRSGVLWLVAPRQAWAVAPDGADLAHVALPELGEAGAFRLYVDVFPPEVSLLAPADCTAQSHPRVEVSVVDHGSGVVEAGLELWVDGVRQPETWELGDGRVWTQLPVDLEEGEHHVEVVVSDAEGNQARAEQRLTVDLTPPAFR